MEKGIRKILSSPRMTEQIKMTPKSRCVGLTYMWQSVNRRVYQQIANEVVEIGGENIKLHATT